MSRPPAAGRPLTVMVVDDEVQLLRLTARVLQRAGHHVLTADSADEARRIFGEAREAIDLAVLDVVMPGGDGAAELLPELLAERPGLRVILSSGDQLPAGLQTAIDRGEIPFLRKPFAPQALLALLDTPAAASSAPSAAGPSGPGVA